MDEIRRKPMRDFTEVTDIEDTARIIGLQDNENVKIPLQSLTAKILSRVDEDILTVNDINVEGGVTGFNPIGEVKEGDKRAVSGEEVWQTRTSSFNFFSKKGFLIRKTDGQEQANPDYFCTGFINIDLNKDIIVIASNSAAGTPIAFYDKEFNHISSVSEPSVRHGMFVVNKENIPVDSVYIKSGYNILGLAEGLIVQGFTYLGDKKNNDESSTLFTLDGYIHKDSGVFSPDNNYISTELYKIDPNNPLIVSCYKSQTYVGGVYFFDINFKYIGSLYDGVSSVVSREVDYPENTVYVRATALKSQTFYLKNNTQGTIIDRQNNSSNVQSGNLFTFEGYLRNDIGNFIVNSDYRTTDFLPLDFTQALRIRCSGSGNLASPYVFYDKNKKQVLNGFTGNNNIIEKTILPSEFPEDAVYIRCSQRVAEFKNPYIYGITMNAFYNDLKSIENKNNSIKVLNIGSSHGIDMIQSFPVLALKSGVNVRAANLYSSGIRLPAVLDKCLNNEDFETYSVNNDGSEWVRVSEGLGTRTVLNALNEDNWDVIILQRGAYGTNTWTELQQEALFGIVDYINKNTNYSPRILFSMGHPPGVGNTYTPTLEAQNQWYLDSVQGALSMQDNLYLQVIPTGTAVQNARSTFLKNYGTGIGKDLCRDDLHLDTGIGTYITGCLLFEFIIGDMFSKSILTENYIPKLEDINGITGNASTFTPPSDRMAEVARYCAIAAKLNPYEISEKLAINFEIE